MLREPTMIDNTSIKLLSVNSDKQLQYWYYVWYVVCGMAADIGGPRSFTKNSRIERDR